ncbi:MAG: hypothetical protein RLZ35_974 [Pseudomonadota bacterium]|jgi:putative ubiquitin-RnfH superfamily antitoxin RatB of RatAB toxin-antitoxin module
MTNSGAQTISYIHIEVIYVPAKNTGTNELVWKSCLKKQSPCTVADALQASGVLLEFPEINLTDSHKVGIFGKLVSMHTLLQDKDRLEIYRPLTQDPKILRRKRAREQKHVQQHRNTR